MIDEYEYSGRYAMKPLKGTPEFYMKDLDSIKVAIKGNLLPDHIYVICLIFHLQVQFKIKLETTNENLGVL